MTMISVLWVAKLGAVSMRSLRFPIAPRAEKAVTVMALMDAAMVRQMA